MLYRFGVVLYWTGIVFSCLVFLLFAGLGVANIWSDGEWLKGLGIIAGAAIGSLVPLGIGFACFYVLGWDEDKRRLEEEDAAHHARLIRIIAMARAVGRDDIAKVAAESLKRR